MPETFQARILTPSKLPAGPPIQPTVIRLGGRLALTGASDMAALGEAVHGFLAADDRTRPNADRLEMATGLLQRWSITALAPTDAVAAADRLWAYLAKTWPVAMIHREWPVTSMVGEQRLVGRVDLIVEHAGGYALIDHKSFPGGEEHWPNRCGIYQPQLRAYADAIQDATGRNVTGLFLHLPVPGVLLAL